MRERFQKIREIYTMYDDSYMILRSSYHIKEYGDARDMSLLEEKVRAAAKDPESRENYISSAPIVCLLEARPDVLPYDRMVELGFFPENPEAFTSATLTPRELSFSPILLGFRSHLDTINDYPRPYETAEPLKKAQYVRAQDDLRPADLLFIYCQRSALAKCGNLIDYYTFNSLSPRQRKRFLERSTDWLISIPKAQADRSFNAYTIDSLLGIKGSSSMNTDARDDAYYAALRRLLDSPWKARRNPNYDPRDQWPPNNQKTYGEIIKGILEEHDHPTRSSQGERFGLGLGMMRDPFAMTSVPDTSATKAHDAGAATTTMSATATATTATVHP